MHVSARSGLRSRHPRQPWGDAQVLAFMILAASVIAFASAALPISELSPVRLHAALGGLGLLLTAVLWFAGHSRRMLHASCVALTAGACTLVASAATTAGEVAAAISLLWVPIYAAFFFSRRAVRLYVALVAAGFAASLAVNWFVGAVHVWLLVVLTTAASAEAIASLVARLRDLATRDPLTGLLNRAGLDRAASRVLLSAGRSGAPLTVVVVDLDGFKQINDEQGHAAGDQLLVDLARSWQSVLRADEVLARHGGDEFVLVLPGTSREDADQVMTRLSAASPVSWSYGRAAWVAPAGLADLLLEADRDLYAAKAARARPGGVPAQRSTVDLPV